MLSQFLKSNINKGILSLAVVLIVIFIIILVLEWIGKLKTNFKNLIGIAGSFLSGLGILFTFYGISLALYEFNVSDIEGSIKPLLEGMKTAFTSSLIGIAGNLILKIILGIKISTEKEKKKDNSISGLKDELESLNEKLEKTSNFENQKTIIELLENLNDNIKNANNDSMVLLTEALNNNFKDLKEDIKETSKELIQEFKNQYELEKEMFNRSNSSLNSIKDALVGDGEISLVSQIKELRKSNEDNLSSLANSFITFSETMAEQNSKAFIEALEETIKDFNLKLSEQFGENFKELNKAVFELVEWQENYKHYIEGQEEHFNQFISKTDDISNAMISIKNTNQDIVNENKENNNLISSTITITNNELLRLKEENNDLINSINSLSEMKKSAENAVPQITEKINKIVEELRNSLDYVVSNSNTQNDSIKVQTRNLKTLTETFNSEVKKMFGGIEDNLKSVVEQTNSKLMEKVSVLEDSLEKQLTFSLKGLGENTVTFTKAVRKDYEELADKINSVVEFSKRIDA